jgi:tetratricopeptide (TPR) repeat protein
MTTIGTEFAMNSKRLSAECREQSAKSYSQRAVSKELIAKGLKLYALCSTLLAICSMLLAIFLCACALPRIVVLDDPLSPEEHLNLGVTYEKKGELDNALKEYKEASKKLPLAYLYTGNVYYQKKDYEKAEIYYKEAIKKDPTNADAYNNLAWLYSIKKENLDEAEMLVLKALELNPSKKEIYTDTLEKIKGLK